MFGRTVSEHRAFRWKSEVAARAPSCPENWIEALMRMFEQKQDSSSMDDRPDPKVRRALQSADAEASSKDL